VAGELDRHRWRGVEPGGSSRLSVVVLGYPRKITLRGAARKTPDARRLARPCRPGCSHDGTGAARDAGQAACDIGTRVGERGGARAGT